MIKLYIKYITKNSLLDTRFFMIFFIYVRLNERTKVKGDVLIRTLKPSIHEILRLKSVTVFSVIPCNMPGYGRTI